jgi:hypothetical protein
MCEYWSKLHNVVKWVIGNHPNNSDDMQIPDCIYNQARPRSLLQGTSESSVIPAAVSYCSFRL